MLLPLNERRQILAKQAEQMITHYEQTADGLTKASAVDALQLRGVDTQRFIQKLGNASPAAMKSL